MTDALVFSRNRACQLDALLRSLAENASGCFDAIRVLWRGDDNDYIDAYSLCREEHPEAIFIDEINFAHDTRLLLTGDGYVVFFMDDDILFADIRSLAPTPPQLLEDDPQLLTVSLRLGQNTGICYPLDRLQGLPLFQARGADALVWDWRCGDGDFGYPMSLDGHYFRKPQLRDLLHEQIYVNPNTLEDRLMRRALVKTLPEHSACYRRSSLVGVPCNRVTTTHTNRFATIYSYNERELNSRFLEGERIDLDVMRFDKVTAAHQEMRLVLA